VTGQSKYCPPPSLKTQVDYGEAPEIARAGMGGRHVWGGSDEPKESRVPTASIFLTRIKEKNYETASDQRLFAATTICKTRPVLPPL